MSSEDPSRKNRESWNEASDKYQDDHREQLSKIATAWGVWAVPESELNILGDVSGLHVLEFGCGGAQWSIALVGQGARCVGLDLSEGQLSHARKAVAESGMNLPLVHASAECAPFADGSFDLVFCDHGAMTFARPEYTVAEAARILRPGGRLVFNMASPVHELCWNYENDAIDSTLQSDYFSMHTIEEPDGISYQLPYGDWIRLFRKHGLTVDDLIEIRPPENAKTTYPDFVTLEWARKWPAENVWVLVKH